MTAQAYQELILEDIQGLPPKLLAEIMDFVFFVRRRATEPTAYREELANMLLNKELQQLDQDWAAHLEEEFADYAKRYPVESFLTFGLKSQICDNA